MSRTTIAPAVLQAVQAHLDTLPPRGGQRTPYVRARAADLGVSYATLHRALAAEFGAKKRCPREKQVDQGHVDAVVRVKHRAAHLGERERLVTTVQAIEIAEQEGLIPEGAISASTADRRRREVSGNGRTVRRRLSADAPNQVWQVDFSVSKYFAVVDFDVERGDYVVEVSSRRLAYKANNQRRTLWLAQAKDAHSRLRLGLGFVASGESALMGVEFVDHCVRRGDEDEHPMRGIPRGLKIDNGAFKSSKLYDAFVDALGIDDIPTGAMNSASQGLIENSWKQLWKSFEVYAAAKYGEGFRLHLADYNALIHEHLATDAQKQHPDHPALTRAQVYRAGLRAAPLRVLPEGETVGMHAFRPTVRTADDALRVRLDNVFYALPRRVEGTPVQPGDRIRVCVNTLGDAVGVLVDRHAKPFGLERWAPDSYGTFRSSPETYTEHTAKLAREDAREQQRANAVANRQSAEQRRQGGPVLLASGIVTMPARVETITPASPFAEQPAPEPALAARLTADEARIHIGRALRDHDLGTYADWADLLGPHIADGTTRDALDRVLSVLITNAPPAAPMRRTA